jgi:AcrR family transcriptional regulator
LNKSSGLERGMAQVLKDEIRENILKAALQEFYEKGYRPAAMREIAGRAKIPTGLIYSYYKNKESLFEAVLRPVLYDWERVLTARDDGHSEVVYGLSRAETECLLNLFEHRQECIILFDKSGGTKYETEKDRFIAAIEEHLNKHKKDTDGDEIFIHIIANNFVDGLMQVMYHYKGKEWAMMILHKLSEMYLSGIGL